MPNETIIYKSKARLKRGALKYFGFFALGILFWWILFKLGDKGPTVIPAVLALAPAIGLGGCVYRLWQLRGKQPLLTFSPAGLQYAKWKKCLIPWRAIANGSVYQSNDGLGGTKLCLAIMLEKEIPVEALPGVIRKKVKRGRKAKWPDLLIDLNDSDTTPAQALELLRRFAARY